jgi:pyridoxal phosphate enzyme (YggS family)
VSTDRKAELAENLAEVEARIAAACRAAGRARDEVKLIAITKTFPAADAALLADLGVTDVGENRDQEAGPKAAEVAGLRPDAALRWHMVGRLQRNKARSVVEWAHEVQSVDSARLADALAKAVHTARDGGKREEPLDVLIQASLDDDPERGGCPLTELAALADRIAQSEELRLRGLMAVAPLGADPAAAFERLARAGESLRKDHPNAADVSAGMSHDLEQAITHGSTCVRVGTALLGGRGLASP